jgi:hypothetical protein
MKASLLLATGVTLLAGCVTTSTIPLGQPTPRPAVPWEQVQVFLKEADVPGPFDKVALIKAEGPHDWTSQRDLVDKVRKAAGKVGANGIILEEIKEPSTAAKIAGAVLDVPVERTGSVVAIVFRPTEQQRRP